MASKNDANKAREEYSELLQSLGAHAIGVDEIKKKDKRTFAVIAYMKKQNPDLPGHLTVSAGNKKVMVPLVAKIADKFEAE